MFRPGLGFGQRYHVDHHGQLTLKQLRLSVLNEMHTNSYTGPRLLGGERFIPQTKMAFINMNNSCPRKDFIVSWRSGNTCCSICCVRNPTTFSHAGLQQHYRLMHRNMDFTDVSVKEGVDALHKFVVLETRQNLTNLFELRSKSVSEAL